MSFFRRYMILMLAMVACPFHLALSQQKEVPKERKKEPVSPLIRPQPVREEDSTAKQRDQRNILNEIQNGISKGDAAILSPHFGSQVYISLKGSEGSYYSANQALFVLQNFFSLHRPISFAFSTRGESDEIPFATGRGYFNARGVRESVQIYVSLTQYEGRWVVAEFNVY